MVNNYNIPLGRTKNNITNEVNKWDAAISSRHCGFVETAWITYEIYKSYHTFKWDIP